MDVRGLSTPVYRKILVGYDGRHASKCALRRALQIAKSLGAEVTVLRVLHEEIHYAHPLSAEEAKEVRKIYLADLEKEVKELIKGEDAAGVKVSCDVIIGDPAEEILNYAETKGYDLIVVGRRNVGTLKRILLGSVTTKIVTYAKGVEVLVIEPWEDVCRL